MSSAVPPALLQLAYAGQLRPLGMLASARQALPTGLPPLDDLLNGGLPRQGLTAITGEVSSGSGALGLHLLASAQIAGLLSAWIDIPLSFDPLAARYAGVALDDLLLIRPSSLTAALSIAYDVLCEGGTGLLLLDAGTATLPDASLRLLTHAVGRCSAALIILTESRIPHADLRLHVTRSRWEMASGDIYAVRSRVTVEAGRGVPVGRSAEMLLAVDEMPPCWPAS